VLTRWALFGEVGDLLAPILMAALAALALGWRVAYCLVGAVVFFWALLLSYRAFPAAANHDTESAAQRDGEGAGTDASHARKGDETDDETEPGVFSALGAAMGNRNLLRWLGATALCDLLDELLVVFAALHLRDHLHAGPIARSVVIGAGVVGAIAGVLLADRLLTRMAPLRLLLASCVACTGSYVAWLCAPTVWASALLFFLVGMTAAPMYPIASAQAYAALPGRSGTVNAAGHVFTPLSLGVPWVLGAVADHSSVGAALLILLLQPLGLGVIAWHHLRAAESLCRAQARSMQRGPKGGQQADGDGKGTG
jgi:fucose permease